LRGKHRESRVSNGGKIFGFILLVLLVTAAAGLGVLWTLDIGGETLADMAAKAVKERTGMTLSIARARGNPLRGYVFEDASLSSDGRRIFEAKTLEAKVDFLSLLRSPRLALLAIGGVDMDMDRLAEEISKIRLPPSSGGDIPVDLFRLQDSRFTSAWGTVGVSSVEAAFRGSRLNAALSVGVNGVPVSGTAEADIRDASVSVDRLELRLGGTGTATLAGSVGTGAGAPVDLQGSLKGLDVSELASFWPAFLSSEDYAGTADAEFTAEGAGENLLITAVLGFKGSRLGGWPLEDLSTRVRYANMRITAENVKATVLSVPLEGEIAAAFRRDGVPSVMVKLNGSNAPLTDIARLYPGIGKAGGKVDRFALSVQGPTDALSGTADLAAASVVLSGKRIENLALQVKLARSDSATVNGKFVLEGAQGYVQGSVGSLLRGPALNLTAKLLNLDVKKMEDLIPDGKKYALSGSLSAELAIQGKMTSPSVSGRLSSPKFSVMGYALDKPFLSFAYDKDVFRLKESGGSWDGRPLQASGTVGPLSSRTPAIDMTARASVNPENLKPFIPDIGAYKPRGTLNVGVKLSGNLPSPRAAVSVVSLSLSALDGAIEVKNLEAATTLTADPGGPGGPGGFEKADVSVKAASAAAWGVGLQNLSASIRKDGQRVRLENVSARSGKGSLGGGGAVVLGGNGADLDLAFDLRELDLAPLAKSGGLGVALAGSLSGKVSVKGPSPNPEISFTAEAPSVSAEGVTLTALRANVSGNAKALNLKEFRANVGSAPLSATGSFSLAAPFAANVDISGTGLDLAALTERTPLKGQVSGRFDLKFGVKSSGQGLSGSGSLRSDAAAAFGIKASGIALPLSLSGNTFKSEKGTLSLYGGKVTNSLTFDLKSMKFSDTLSASGVDVNALAQDASGGLGGKVTGRGNLSLKIDGSAGKTLSYSGKGQFDMGEGSITGFTGLNILGALYNVDGIRYTKAAAPLRLETGKLFVGKGASMTPPANDPIYKSAKLAEDGSVTFDKKLYFVLDANVNFQLINALTGGASGGLDALARGGGLQDLFGGKNLEDVLKGAVSGAGEGARDTDFRDVTVKTTGTIDKPSVSLVKVGPSSRPAQQPAKTETSPTAPSEIPAAQRQEQQSPEDLLKEKLLERLLPGSR
jgi:translocation and assembly module TamB